MLSYVTAMARFADFDGRASRAEFWMYTATAGAIAMASRYAAARWQLGFPLFPLVTMAHAIPTTTIQIRRLHDTGRTGYWLWIALTGIGVLPLIIWFCQRSVVAPSPISPFAAAKANRLINSPGAPQVEITRGELGEHHAVSVSDQSRGTDWGMVVGLVALLGLGVLVWAYGQADLHQVLAGLQIEGPVATSPEQVSAAFAERGLDKAILVPGSNNSDLTGFPLRGLVNCMASKTAFGGTRKVAFFDEGSRAYRLIMTEPGKGDFAFHFALVQPGMVTFDEASSPTASTTDADRVDAALEALLLSCMPTGK